jgi:hemerythrin-like domain-containing protein
MSIFNSIKKENMMDSISRRRFMSRISVVGMGFLAGACGQDEVEGEVTAVEDLMREHGVLRRALMIYQETAPKLLENPTPTIADALQKTANLFRTFGEDYHEKRLEEAFIFPALKKGNAAVSSLVETLIKQHDAGRQATDYILAVTQAGKIEAIKSAEMAKTLESFVLMYQNHAAREDTIIFPAWKQMLSSRELEEMGDKFEDIEHEQFGEDGFEKAVRQIAEIESALGLADIGQFTVLPPPKV